MFAAINGHAIGVGITYPMTCDVRIVAEDAKVQFAFVRPGVLPELWSHKIVSQMAGLSNAADLLLTGRMISGRELVDLGLASAALEAQRGKRHSGCRPVTAYGMYEKSPGRSLSP